MKEYQKIGNIFRFDEKRKSIIGLNEPYQPLQDIIWQGTEKVDGTNIRVHWDGHTIEYAGRTDRAEIPGHLRQYLDKTFKTPEMEYIFEQVFGDSEAYIFGEGYGYKIQNGTNYLPNYEVGFIVFDVNIGGYDLNRANVDDVAKKLGLESVPVVFEGTLEDAVDYVKEHGVSNIGALHELEGIVLQPRDVQLYDNKHNLIKCKCKRRDLYMLREEVKYDE